MKYIDIDGWNRKNHFSFFQNRIRPQIEITATVNISCIVNYRHRHGVDVVPRLSDMLYYIAAKSANNISEFRMRLLDKRPVEFSTINVAFTYRPANHELHANCVAPYVEDFSQMVRNITAARVKADEQATLTPQGGEGQNLFYFSILPGIAFSSIANPWGDPWVDSVPRIIFGKIVEGAQGNYQIPVSVEALHSFVDGIHIEKLFKSMTELASSPETTFS